jgi:LacI family transcriptional regulator
MNPGKLVGMIIPDGTNQFFSTLAQLFQRELAQRQCGLFVANSDGSKSRELSNLTLFFSMNVDGIVFISVGDSSESFRHLAEFTRPVIVLDREIPLENADFVLTDNAHGIRMAVDYLASLGHRKIGYIQGAMTTEPGRERYSSFMEIMGSLEIPVDKSMIFPGDFLFGSGTSAADKLLAMPRETWPSALLASNDLMALGAMQRLQESGIKIPDDISIIGYDDIILASWAYPRLTTVRQDAIMIARVGAGFLLDRLDKQDLENQNYAESRVSLVSPTLVKRNSCSLFKAANDLGVEK